MNFRLIRNAKIRTKLLVCLIVLGSLTAVIGFLANYNITSINKQFSVIVDVSTPRLIALLELKSSAAQIETSVTKLGAATGSLTSQSGSATDAKNELLANLESLQNAQTDYARKAKAYPDKVKLVNAAVGSVSAGATLLVSATEQRAPASTLAPLYASLHSAVGSLAGKTDQLIDNETYQLRKSNAAADSNVATQQTISGLVLLMALLMVVAVGILTSRLIVRPLARLRKDVELITKGDLDVKIPLGATDEVGELSTAIDKLRITVKYLLDDAKMMDQEAKQKK